MRIGRQQASANGASLAGQRWLLPIDNRLLLAALPLIVAGIWRAIVGGSTEFPNDDAYIAIHSARHLFDAQDPSFGGSPLTGATSLAHVGALWFAMLALAPLAAAECLAWLGAAVYFAGVSCLVVARHSHPMAQLAAMTVASLAGSAGIHLANGQETVWAAAAVVWALFMIERDPAGRGLLWGCAAMPWIRPDLAVLSTIVLLWRWKRYGIRFGDVVVVVLGWGTYAALLWAATGDIVPNTLAAKREFFATYSLSTIRKLEIASVTIGLWLIELGPASTGLFLAWRRPGSRVVAAALVATLASLVAVSPDVISHNFHRYLFPLGVPAIVAGLSVTPQVSRVVLVAAVVWVVVWAPLRWRHWAEARGRYVDGQQQVANWLNDVGEPGAKVLVHDAGYLSETTQAQLVDLVGLKTPSSTETHRRMTGPSAGTERARAIDDIACRSRPEYLVVLSSWDDAFGITLGLKAAGWSLVPVFPPGGTDRKLGHYSVYRVEPSRSCGRAH